MSDEARPTPGEDPFAPAASPATAAQPQAPLSGGVTVAAPPPAGDEWGELSTSLFSIWTRPRQTIRRIVSVNPRYGVVLLAALSGASASFMRWPGEAGPSLGFFALVVFACTVGPLLSIAFLWIGAWIVRGLGHALMGGTATPPEMRAALAWANVPQVTALPITLLMSVLATPTVGLGGSIGVGALVLLLGLGAMVLSVWGIVIASNTVAEVQGYRSAWKGLGNLLLPLGIVFLIGIAAAILIPLAARR